MKSSNISWTDATFNPWWGCAKISEGCANCYAETFARRVGEDVWGALAERRFFSEETPHWKEPLNWQWQGFMICPGCGGDLEAKLQRGSGVPLSVAMCACGSKQPPRQRRNRRVFSGSMCDWLEDREDLTRPLAKLLALIHATPFLTWQLLSKRPENWRRRLIEASQCFATGNIVERWLNGEAPANVWVGATGENQPRAESRATALLDIPARVRFLSIEPMLGPVNLLQVPPVEWVICGGESGNRRRPFEIGWAESLADDCAALGIPFFMKQDGGPKPGQRGGIPDALWNIKQFPA